MVIIFRTSLQSMERKQFVNLFYQLVEFTAWSEIKYLATEALVQSLDLITTNIDLESPHD